MVIDGDVHGLDAGSLAAVGAVAGAAHPGTPEAAQLLDVQVEQFAGLGAFIAHDGGDGNEVLHAVEMVMPQDAADGRTGDRQQTTDLRVGHIAATQGDDLRL